MKKLSILSLSLFFVLFLSCTTTSVDEADINSEDTEDVALSSVDQPLDQPGEVDDFTALEQEPKVVEEEESALVSNDEASEEKASLVEDESDLLSSSESTELDQQTVDNSDIESYSLDNSGGAAPIDSSDILSANENKELTAEQKEVQEILDEAEMDSSSALVDTTESQVDEVSDLEKEYNSESMSKDSKMEVVEDTPALATSTSSDKKSKSSKVSKTSKRQVQSKSASFDNDGEFVNYVIQPKDTLSSISLAMYGTGSKWNKIASDNNIQDPNKVYPGDVLKIKKTPTCKDLLTNYNSSEKQTYTVKKGDTLAKIAGKVLDSAKSWKYLYSFNKDTITDPNVLSVGQKIFYVYPYPRHK